MTLPDPDTLRARALKMVPQLRARADECATGRRIPDANLDELFSSGLFDVVKPKPYGGYEMGMDVFCDLVMIIASGCGSTGWVYCVVGSHPTFVVNFSKEVQDEVWAETPNALISSAKMLEGSFRKVDGGYRGSGVMTFSSGCLHADWIFAGGNPVEGQKKPITVLLQKEQVEVLDTWPRRYRQPRYPRG